MTATKLDKLLIPDPAQPLGKLVQHARNMQELAGALRAELGGWPAQHLLAANVHDDGTLVLICSSASWAARLRFESARLLAAAARAGSKVHRLRVRVASGRRSTGTGTLQGGR